jgi:hypothetical protein
MFQDQIFRDPGLVAVRILANSCHCGIALTQIAVPEGCTILGILRGSKIILLDDDNDPVVHFEDYVLAVALHPALLPALKVALKKMHRVYYSLNDCAVRLSVENEEDNLTKSSCFSEEFRNLVLQDDSFYGTKL